MHLSLSWMKFHRNIGDTQWIAIVFLQLNYNQNFKDCRLQSAHSLLAQLLHPDALTVWEDQGKPFRLLYLHLYFHKCEKFSKKRSIIHWKLFYLLQGAGPQQHGDTAKFDRRAEEQTISGKVSSFLTLFHWLELGESACDEFFILTLGLMRGRSLVCTTSPCLNIFPFAKFFSNIFKCR